MSTISHTHTISEDKKQFASRRMLKTLRSPVLLFIIALAVRLSLTPGYVSLVSQQISTPCGHNEPGHIAAHLANGEGFSSPYDGVPLAPTAQQPPLYPLLLAGIFKLFGTCSLAALWVITGINAIVGAAISPLISTVGRRNISPATGVIAGWIWAISPVIVAVDLLGSNYPLSTLAVLLWLLIAPSISDSAHHCWIVLGITLGLAALLNPMLLVLLPASAGWLLADRKRAAALAIVAIIMVAPWIVRNYVELGHFYPIRDNFGLELYIGNHAGMREHLTRSCGWNLCDGTDDYGTGDFPDHSPLFATAGEATFMEARRQEAIAYIRSQPAAFLIRSAKRVASFWLLPYPWLSLATFLLMCLGIRPISGPTRIFFLTMLALYPLSFYATHVAWVASYRHPIEPLIALSAATALTTFTSRCRHWVGVAA